MKCLSFLQQVPNGELADTLNRFIVPDFVVATEESKIVAMQVCTGWMHADMAGQRRGYHMRVLRIC